MVTTYFALASVQVRDGSRAVGSIWRWCWRQDGGDGGPDVGGVRRGDHELQRRLLRKGAGADLEVQRQVSDHAARRCGMRRESEVEAADYMPTTQFDVEEMWAELRGYVSAFANAELRRLVFAFLDDPEIGPAFRDAPAAKRLHHAWLGGLLEHVLTLVRVCRAAAPFYPEVDPDLLVTGAILHDIGKVRELSWKIELQLHAGGAADRAYLDCAGDAAGEGRLMRGVRWSFRSGCGCWWST